MPVYKLTKALLFPPPDMADPDGLLAVGGDLSVERLLLAYSSGIFPWYTDKTPIMWWSPDPRLVLFPPEIKISRSLRQTITKCTFDVTFDKAFEEVIRHCAEVHREKDGGTWITEDMISSYVTLHRRGYAHSVESWREGRLVGGLYGVAIGKAFFGESMFSTETDASKVATAYLAKHLEDSGFSIIDCQVRTEHLVNLGAREISRREFMDILGKSICVGIGRTQNI